MKYLLIVLILLTTNSQALPLSTLKLPPGFSISIYASNIPDARSMALGKNNVVFVSTRTDGRVYAVVPDKNGTKVLVVASGLNMPNGIALHQGNLYIADVDKLYRIDDIENHLSNPPKPVLVIGNFPSGKDHGWRYMRIKDDKIYMAIGSPCNTCITQDNRLGSIMRMDVNGGAPEIIARGIRNSVGFDWDPVTQNLAFTDNGRDLMGDDLPPEELNIITKTGQNFGFPYCYGFNTQDPEYGNSHPCSQFTPPVLEMPAHVAPLGVKYYTGKMFPKEYQNQIFIAQHGSWNRSTKIGYQVAIVTKVNNKYSWKPFISGWLNNGKVWGRPVDFLIMPDGSLLISDDHAGVIYRITYSGET